jgi:hypothetical protein
MVPSYRTAQVVLFLGEPGGDQISILRDVSRGGPVGQPVPGER